MTTDSTITSELLDQLLANYSKPEDRLPKIGTFQIGAYVRTNPEPEETTGCLFFCQIRCTPSAGWSFHTSLSYSALRRLLPREFYLRQ